MSQKKTSTSGKKLSKFDRMKKEQHMHETRVQYEQLAPRVLGLLALFWTLLWVTFALAIPSAVLWILLFWGVGGAALGGAQVFLRVQKSHMQKKLQVTKPLEELYKMNPLDFEHAVAKALTGAGMREVRVTAASQDGGIDIWGLWNSRRIAVQCKKYYPDSFIAIDQLRAFVYAMHKKKAEGGIYVTTAKYGDYARKEMEEQGVLLIDGKALVEEGMLEQKLLAWR